jgi:hypothetical protein
LRPCLLTSVQPMIACQVYNRYGIATAAYLSRHFLSPTKLMLTHLTKLERATYEQEADQDHTEPRPNPVPTAHPQSSAKYDWLPSLPS